MFFEVLNALYRDLKDEAAAVYGDAHSAVEGWAKTDVRPRGASPGSKREKRLGLRGLIGGLKGMAFAVSTEAHFSAQELKVVISESAATVEHRYRVVREEVHLVAIAAYEEAHAALHHLSEAELKPLREAAGEEWRALTSAVAEEEGLLADARELMGMATNQVAALGKKALAPIRNLGHQPFSRHSARSIPTAREVGRALKQAKDLLFADDIRNRQFDEMSVPAAGSARSQIAYVESICDRYLKIAASSAVASLLGVLFLPPLKLVAAGMILYSCGPAFKSAYTDVVKKHRITIPVLDSFSFIGLLAGGYFVICSVTSTIFHISMKMMLKTEDRSRQILGDMFGQQPRTVLVVVNGVEQEIPFEQLRVGDTLVVHAGLMIPIDGTIAAGTAAIDQHVLTGEAQPAEKGVGDKVFAATILLAGRIEVRVEKAGAETAAAQIRELLATTTDFRTAVQARWRDVADRTVLPTLGLSGLALVTLSPASALAVINSNYVAVMRVASPLGMLNFLQRASQRGLLVKDGRAMEAACKVDTVVFDKTGTLTENQPHVGQIYPSPGVDADDLLTCAAAVEAKQTHPIAHAILQAARERNLSLPELEEARYEVGYGIRARIGDRQVRLGSARYMSMEGIALPDDVKAHSESMQARGASVVFVAFGDALAGALELRPTLRPEAKQIVQDLHERGLTLYIISGDHAAPTQALAEELGIDHYLAQVLPQDKSLEVERLQKQGRRVCFVGDGINDAIALKQANVSVSIRGASTLATDTAQIILMDESLKQLPQLFEVASDYAANLRTLMTTTLVPGLVSLGGVFFLGFGNPAALLLFNLSMMAGLMNAIFPALRQQTTASRNPSIAVDGGRVDGIKPDSTAGPA